MVETIKTNYTDSYFFDNNTNQRIDRYTPNENIMFKFKKNDDLTIYVYPNSLKVDSSGNTYFQYENDKYFISDGYQDEMVRCGYFIMDNYDKMWIKEKEEGIRLRDEFLNILKQILEDYPIENQFKGIHFKTEITRYAIKMEFQYKGFYYHFMINTVNYIVTQNEKRKEKNMAFFPFANVDKYGSLYFSGFCRKLDIVPQKDYDMKYKIIDQIVGYFHNHMKNSIHHNFHYWMLSVNRRITL